MLLRAAKMPQTSTARAGVLRSVVATNRRGGASAAPVAQVIRAAALPAAFCAVAGLDPAADRFKEVGGLLRQPLELRQVPLALHHHQGPFKIDGVVGGDAKFAARLQL